jgi:hypothetical protein
VLGLLPRMTVQYRSVYKGLSLAKHGQDLCAVCEEPFYSKRKFIRCVRCVKCDSHFHSNCLQTGVSETSVRASTGKPTYNCDSCKKLTGDIANELSISKSNQKEALSTETEPTASHIGDNDSLNLQR